MPRADVRALCLGAVSSGDDVIVLLKFEPRNNHVMAEIAREMIEFKQDRIYRITIEEEGE